MMFNQLSQTALQQYQRYAQLYFPLLCQPRPIDSHKGTFGTLAIIGGQSGMSGSIILAGSAALKTGCGKVWLGFNQTELPLPVLYEQPEIMLATAGKLLQRQDITATIAGCGLGTDDGAQALLHTILRQQSCPLVLDADALNLLACNPPLQAELHQNGLHALVLTPHPAEAARLLQCTTAEIQRNRPKAALQLAQNYHAWIVLKGHHSLIVSPHGQIHQNPTGNPGLATAGSGDVLSGIIGSLLAQKLPLTQAIAAAVWLHGAASDILAANGTGPIGLCAGEIAAAARWLRNQLTRT